MSANLNRRLLQVAAGLSAIHFLTGGGFYLWRGVAGLSLFTPSPLPIDAADPKSGTAEFKACAVRVERAGADAPADTRGVSVHQDAH